MGILLFVLPRPGRWEPQAELRSGTILKQPVAEGCDKSTDAYLSYEAASKRMCEM